MRRWRKAARPAIPAAALVCLALVGCGGAGPQKGGAAHADPPVYAGAEPEDPGRLASGGARFALDLSGKLGGSPDDNLAFAPYAISEMLGMAYCGARGRTADEMAQALHFGVPAERLPASFAALDADLAAAQKGDARLALACGLWTRKGIDLPADYREHVVGSMRAAADQLDFVGNTEGARGAINSWVAGRTGGAIRDLLPPGAVGEDTAVVLASAVHFEARWDLPFDAGQTRAATFHSPKRDRPTQMMTRVDHFHAFAGGGGVKAVELPFQGSRLVLDLILPDAPAGAVEAADPSKWAAGLQEHQVKLRLPRFQFSTHLDLAPPLAALGMPDAFGRGADFGGLTNSRDFALSRVVHQALVRVNEDGMSASAATGGSIGTLSIGDEPDFEFTADRPFLFVLRDPKTGVVLFLGRVAEPE